MNKKSWLAISIAIAVALLIVSRAMYSTITTGSSVELVLSISAITVLIIFLAVFVPIGVSTANRLTAVQTIRAHSSGLVVFSVAVDNDLMRGLDALRGSTTGSPNGIARFLVVKVQHSSVEFWTAEKVPKLLAELGSNQISAFELGELPYAYGTRACLFLAIYGQPEVNLPLLVMNEGSPKYFSQTSKQSLDILRSSKAVLGAFE